jgi:hypothetical protein
MRITEGRFSCNLQYLPTGKYFDILNEQNESNRIRLKDLFFV